MLNKLRYAGRFGYLKTSESVYQIDIEKLFLVSSLLATATGTQNRKFPWIFNKYFLNYDCHYHYINLVKLTIRYNLIQRKKELKMTDFLFASRSHTILSKYSTYSSHHFQSVSLRGVIDSVSHLGSQSHSIIK